jgi:hypothetical protein
MLKLIDFLIFGCWHRWQIKEQFNVKEGTHYVGTAYVCQCQKCGKPQRFNCY